MQGEKSERRRIVVIAAIVIAGFVAFQQFGSDIDIEQLLEDLSNWLGDWTYALVGLLAFLETGAFVGLIFPGETAVILGGAVAGQGETEIVITIAIVWFCAWAGDSTSFLIGTRLGREFVLKHGSKVLITKERFEQVERYFQSHGGKTILIGRFIGLVRALAPFIAGSSGMKYRAFVPFSVMGTGLWAAAFSLLGYALANSIDRATEIAGTGALVFGTTVAVIVGIVVIHRYLSKQENRDRLARRIESLPGVRRVLPQLRFLWARVTPGGLGLEFTTLMAVLSVSAFVVVGYASILSGDPGPTPGDEQAIEIVDSLRADWLTDIAKVVTELGSTPALIVVALAAGAGLAWNRRW
jgi:membrane protein DedA with SNARE-associated domain